MKKRLTAIGNSLGLVIEKPILELLKIDRDTEMEMTTDGDRLILAPVRSARDRKILETAKRILSANEETFRKLAK